MSDIFHDLAHGQEIAEVQQAATDNRIPHEILMDYTFREDLDYLDQESEEEVAKQLELEQKKSEILGVVNCAFLKEALSHIGKTMGSPRFFKYGADGLDAEQWLAYYQNTDYVGTTPLWILGEQPRLSRGGPLVFEYIVGATHEDTTDIDLMLATTEQFIKPVDPIPPREEVENAYDPRTGTFSIPHYRHRDVLKGPAAIDIHTIKSVSDEEMKSFQVAVGLMDLLAGFNALDNSDELIENYKIAREWSLKLADASNKRQHGLVFMKKGMSRQEPYATPLAIYLGFEEEAEPWRNPWG